MKLFKDIVGGERTGYSLANNPTVYFIKLLKESSDGYNAVSLYPFALMRIEDNAECIFLGYIGFKQRG